MLTGKEGKSQNDNIMILPPLDSLQTLLYNLDSTINEAEQIEFRDNYRFNWLNLAPSVGVVPVYDYKHEYIYLRPTASINISGLVSSLKERRAIKRKLLSIESRNKIEHQRKRINLTTAYNSLKDDIIELGMLLDIHKQYKAIYELKKQQYKANEINSESYLTASIQYSERKRVIINQINTINSKMIVIELLLNASVFNRLSYSLVNE